MVRCATKPSPRPRKRASVKAFPLIVAAAALVVGLSSTAPSATKHPVAAAAAPLPDQRGTEQQPAVITGDITSHVPADEEAKHDAAEARKVENDRSLTKATWYMVYVTAAAAVAALLSIYVTYRTAQSAKVSADAAKESADVLPRLERAYLFATVVLQRWSPTTSTPFVQVAQITLQIRNHGKTPAELSRVTFNAAIGESIRPETAQSPSPFADLPPGIAVAPDGLYEHVWQVPVTEEQWAALIRSTQRLYVVGEVTYVDVLGATHRTGYCWWTIRGEDGMQMMLAPTRELNFRT